MNTPPTEPTLYAANAVRLSWKGWLVVGCLLCGIAEGLPLAWQRLEPLPLPANPRIPFRLGNDYWVFKRYAQHAASAHQTLVLGDSVVWGHYVGKDATLTAHLNRLRGSEQFTNLGVDGIHPAALAGLIDYYGGSLRDRQVLLSCNLLWMSSPQHDLTGEKEFAFNHPSLVPQFWPRIPCYREPLSTRLSYVVGRHVGLFSWAKHLQVAYLEGNDWASWTLDHPRQSPRESLPGVAFARRTSSPSPQAESWTRQGIRPANFRWVDFDRSLQWQSFRRAVASLVAKHNHVFVVVGPFNEHMVQPQSLAVYRQRLAVVEAWLTAEKIPTTWPPSCPVKPMPTPVIHSTKDMPCWRNSSWQMRRFSEFVRTVRTAD